MIYEYVEYIYIYIIGNYINWWEFICYFVSWFSIYIFMCWHHIVPIGGFPYSVAFVATWVYYLALGAYH